MIYLANAFSLQMLQGDYVEVSVSTISAAYVRQRILEEGFVSAIGHVDTARVLSSILRVSVEMNRVSVTLTPEDELIVAQVVGGRLPEGCTTLPDGVLIVFKCVRVIRRGGN